MYLILSIFNAYDVVKFESGYLRLSAVYKIASELTVTGSFPGNIHFDEMFSHSYVGNTWIQL